MNGSRKCGIYIQWNVLHASIMEILPRATMWMDLEVTMLGEISQTEKDKYYNLSLTCGI